MHRSQQSQTNNTLSYGVSPSEEGLEKSGRTSNMQVLQTRRGNRTTFLLSRFAVMTKMSRNLGKHQIRMEEITSLQITQILNY